MCDQLQVGAVKVVTKECCESHPRISETARETARGLDKMGDHSTEPIFLAWSIYEEIEKLRQHLDGVDRYRPPTAKRPQVDYVNARKLSPPDEQVQRQFHMFIAYVHMLSHIQIDAYRNSRWQRVTMTYTGSIECAVLTGTFRK